MALTDAEKLMLVKALPGGEILKLRGGQVGEFIRSGMFSYLDERDRAVQEHGFELLDSLIRQGLVHHVADQVYKLTGTGFDCAREYAKEMGAELASQ